MKGKPKMAGQRKGRDWAHYGTFRNTWISEADRIMKECAEWTATEVSDEDKARRLWRRSAHLSERAADFYRQAGLGLMGALASQKAAERYAALDMHEDAARCKLKAIAIPVYWSDDQPTQFENRGGHP